MFPPHINAFVNENLLYVHRRLKAKKKKKLKWVIESPWEHFSFAKIIPLNANVRKTSCRSERREETQCKNGAAWKSGPSCHSILFSLDFGVICLCVLSAITLFRAGSLFLHYLVYRPRVIRDRSSTQLLRNATQGLPPLPSGPATAARNQLPLRPRSCSSYRESRYVP